MSPPIRGQCSGHVICLHQSEASIEWSSYLGQLLIAGLMPSMFKSPSTVLLPTYWEKGSDVAPVLLEFDSRLVRKTIWSKIQQYILFIKVMKIKGLNLENGCTKITLDLDWSLTLKLHSMENYVYQFNDLLYRSWLILQIGHLNLT